MRKREEFKEATAELTQWAARNDQHAVGTLFAVLKLQLEVLLDIRDALAPQKKVNHPKSAPPPRLNKKGSQE